MITYFAKVCILEWPTSLPKEVFIFVARKIHFSFSECRKQGCFVKKLPNIWCKFEPLHLKKILDHILLTIYQMFACQMIFIHLSPKRQISIDSAGTGSNLNYMCLIVCSLFFQKIISRYTSSHLIIDPPRGLQDSTPSYHRSCPPF